MQIESIKVQKFRSLENVDLMEFGPFNAFVGRNNSGKSTILLAIETFLTLIQTGGILYNPLSIGNKKDFFLEDCSEPISITIKIKIDDELGTILNNILKREIDGKSSLFKNSSLQLTILIHNKKQTQGKGFGHLNDVRVITNTLDPEHQSEIIFFNFDYAGAVELQIRENTIHDKVYDLKYLSEINDKRLKKIIDLTTKDQKFLPIFVEGKNKEKIKIELSKGTKSQLNSIIEEDRNLSSVRRKITDLQIFWENEIRGMSRAHFSSEIITIAGKGSVIPLYLPEILNYFSKKKIIHLNENRPTLGENESQKILSLKTQRDKKRSLLDIQKILSELVGVDIDAFEDVTSTKSEKKAELDIDGISAELSGYGIKEVLRIVLDIELLNPDIFMIDEPEVHLHPGLEVNLMKYLIKKSEKCQIFISTHSTNFLDLCEKKNIYLVSKTRSSSVKPIHFENDALAIPQELGIRLSSFFIYDRLVFVEGPSDIDIIKIWATKLGKNLSKYNIGFIPMGGKRNMGYFAADETLSFLSKRQIKVWFLRDRDEMCDSEINEIRKKLGNNAIFIPLKKREIENYLLCPQTLFQFLKLKRDNTKPENSQRNLTIESVKESLNRCCDKLKTTVIDKRVVNKLGEPIYFSDIFRQKGEAIIKERMRSKFAENIEKLKKNKSKIESCYQEESDYINSVWESERMNLVQGNVLLDCVCKEYGFRFKKIPNSSELANLMIRDEINSEIVEFIEEIIK